VDLGFVQVTRKLLAVLALGAGLLLGGWGATVPALGGVASGLLWSTNVAGLSGDAPTVPRAVQAVFANTLGWLFGQPPAWHLRAAQRERYEDAHGRAGGAGAAGAAGGGGAGRGLGGGAGVAAAIAAAAGGGGAAGGAAPGRLGRAAAVRADPEKVERLHATLPAFARADVERALVIANNNEDAAANYLLEHVQPSD
jgi:hypothetical protein